MSSKILFLYFKQKHKVELTECENIIKALFRKFKKSVVFSYMQIDTSLSCRDAFVGKLSEEIARHHAILIKSSIENSCEEEVFIKEILRINSAEYHSAGKVICYPSSTKTVEISDSAIKETYLTSTENINNATELAIGLSCKRKHLLTICTKSENGTDSVLFSTFQDHSDKSVHLASEHISFNDMIALCMKMIPTFDTVLTTEEIAEILAMHLDSSARICSGNTVMHTELGTAYLSSTTWIEEMSNARFASVLMAFSEILSRELDMNSASDWLKRAVATSFEIYAYTPLSEFSAKVISEIQKPMRIKK